MTALAAVLAAATRIADDPCERCDYLPPCAVCDELCDCLRRAKLALDVPADRDVTAEYAAVST